LIGGVPKIISYLFPGGLVHLLPAYAADGVFSAEAPSGALQQGSSDSAVSTAVGLYRIK
jgi:hypothetical protein